MSIDPAALRTAIERVVEAVHPLEIIAFGSRARGEARPDSDLDLLVIMPESLSSQERFNQAVDLHELLADMPFAKDILVENPGWSEADRLSPVYQDALHDGIAVWKSGSMDQSSLPRLCQ